MLSNYVKLNNGVVKQVERTKFPYDNNYISGFMSHTKNSVDGMSALRLGHTISQFGGIPDSILDFGCGYGGFIKKCTSVIPNCYACDIAEVHLPERVLKHDPDITYDVITFFDSLEHVDDIWQTVRSLKCKTALISLPWCHYFSDTWFQNWKHRKPNEHLWHFDLPSLKAFMAECGFDLVSSCNVEDAIRRNGFAYPNILTCFFKKS